LVFGSAQAWNFTGSSGHPAAVAVAGAWAETGPADAVSVSAAAAREPRMCRFTGKLLGEST
jgi:hypothetical protein